VRLDELDELMTDLLLFARPPNPQLTPVDVVSLARDTCDLVSRDVSARNVQFVVTGASPPLNADPKLLRSVLLNILINAAHAVQDGGRITTSISGTRDRCVIVVADNGAGIPEEIRDRIFVPFFTTKSRGTGLGLPTAKRLVEAHRGRIQVTCPEEGGTTVTIELPGTV
jgi:two-component system sensor histidine kinase PilS (NtrC family)